MISLPSKPKITSEDGNRAVIEIEGLYPGYGQTIGNGLRRVLLSSLPGAAITTVKIEKVGHEFSTIEGVKEDVVDILLNLKQVRFRLHGEGPFTMHLSLKGERAAHAEDFKASSQVEIVNPKQRIATLTSKKSELEIEATVERGLGYVPVEARSKDKVEVGMIALDSIFSPIRHINYEVENMRVGDRTDYNRIRLHIETDGSIVPQDAFHQAAQILVDQFRALAEGFAKTEKMKESPELSGETKEPLSEDADSEDAVLRMKIDQLKLSSRTLNALKEGGIKTVSGLSRKRESSLSEIEGLGEKGIQEIKKALGNFGITLRQ